MAKADIHISIDIEASGGNVLHHSLLSIGACVVEDPNPLFYMEFKPLMGGVDPEAMRVNGLDLGRLKREGISVEEGIPIFNQWVWFVSGQGESRPIPTIFSAWDWTFLYPYLLTYSGLEEFSNHFSHSPLEMKSWAAGRYRIPFSQTGKRLLGKMYPHLTEGLPPHSHRADEDAVEQGELFRRMNREG